MTLTKTPHAACQICKPRRDTQMDNSNRISEAPASDERRSCLNFNEPNLRTCGDLKPVRTAFDWDLFQDRTRVLRELKESNRFVDVVLVTEDGGCEPVHFTVISALGVKLSDIIEKCMQDPDAPTVTIPTAVRDQEIELKKVCVPKTSEAVLKAIVNCAYTGVISSDSQGIWGILAAGEEYEMTEIIVACCSCLIYQLNIDNCVKLLHLGLKHGHRLRTAAWNMIKAQFRIIVEQSIDFPQLELEELELLLDDDELNIENEETHWVAIKRWVSVDIPVRRQHLPRLIKDLRYNRIPTGFMKSILKDPLLNESPSAKKQIKNMIHQSIEDQKRFKTDGYNLSVGVTKKHLRPRVPHEVVFAMGGWQEGVPTTLVETFDIRTNKWFESKTTHQFPRAYHGVEILHGAIYLIGGTNGTEILSALHRYDPSNGKWNQRANMYEQRCYVSTAVLNHEIYAMGGHNGIQRVRTVERYDHRSNQWTKVPDMNLARSDASATVHDSKIYIAGGLNDQVIENSVEMFNVADQSWTFIQPMNSPRTSLLLVNYKNSLYALGGNNGFERLATVERYDFQTASWTAAPNMSSRRSTFSGCVIEDKLLVVGGYDGRSPINKVEMFDEVRQEWIPTRSIKHDRSGLAVCVLSGLPNSVDFTYIGNTTKSRSDNSNKRR